jgi:hypothetical protein
VVVVVVVVVAAAADNDNICSSLLNICITQKSTQ